MNYAECRRYLQEVLGSGVKFGLNNVRAVLAALRNPHLAYPSVLVAGTNGKGSVCAMLAEILTLHGFRVGLYTSPHLVHVEERVRAGGSPIPRRDFCRVLSRLKGLISGLIASGELESPPTYFEILTILALLYFYEKKVDIAVLEVGMGGRLDATNVVTPLVSVITSVGFDHQEFLGRTLAEIAFEKAGIIKPGVPVVCGRVPRVARRVINRRAREVGVPVRGVLDEPEALSAQRLKYGFRFSLRFGGEEFVFQTKLPGEHQGRNAALAIAAAWELSRSWKRLSKRRIIQGIRKADWPGRLEVISRRPLVVLDGAHNEAGARVVAAYAREFLHRPVTLVFGIMKDKDVRRVSTALFPLADRIFLTSIPMPRAASPEMVYSLAPVRKKRSFLEPNPKKAFERAIRMTPRTGSVLITGSLYLVGELKKLTQGKRKLAPK